MLLLRSGHSLDYVSRGCPSSNGGFIHEKVCFDPSRYFRLVVGCCRSRSADVDRRISACSRTAGTAGRAARRSRPVRPRHPPAETRFSCCYERRWHDASQTVAKSGDAVPDATTGAAFLHDKCRWGRHESDRRCGCQAIKISDHVTDRFSRKRIRCGGTAEVSERFRGAVVTPQRFAPIE